MSKARTSLGIAYDMLYQAKKTNGHLNPHQKNALGLKPTPCKEKLADLERRTKYHDGKATQKSWGLQQREVEESPTAKNLMERVAHDAIQRGTLPRK